MLNLSTPHEFHPVINSRRSEIFAWILAIILVITLIIFISESSTGRILTLVFAGFFVISAILITFGNWVDRSTSLTLNENGIEYNNGLRHVIISWMSIREVRIYSSRIGNKVVVYSAEEFFSFQTLGEFVMSGKIRDRVGFEQGEMILETILYQSELSDSMKHQADGFYYYLRE